MGVGFPAARVAENEPGSFVFGLSGCHVALGARAMLCDLSHLADPSVCTAHGGPAFERKAYLTFFCLPKNSIKRDTWTGPLGMSPSLFLLDLPSLKPKLGLKGGIGVFWGFGHQSLEETTKECVCDSGVCASEFHVEEYFTWSNFYSLNVLVWHGAGCLRRAISHSRYGIRPSLSPLQWPKIARIMRLNKARDASEQRLLDGLLILDKWGPHFHPTIL